MEKRRAGTTDMNLSLLGFGGFHLLEVTRADAERMLHLYLDRGGNYLETAAAYGDGLSEQKIGQAVARRRGEYYLASKCMEREYAAAARSIERSLKNLRTDYLDILFLHAVQTEEEADAVLADNGALKAAREAREAGRVRYIGVTGHGRPTGLLSVTRRFHFDACMTVFNYFDRFNFPALEDVLLPELTERGTAVFGMKALADGYLYRNPVQAIRYALSLPISCVVVGVNRLDQLKEDLEIADLFTPLAADEKEAIFKEAPELGNYVCRQCGRCKTGDFDPQPYFLLEGLFDRQMNSYRVEPPARYALRERLAGWFGQGAEAVADYTAGIPLDPDKDYSALNALCPYRIDIDRKLKIIHAKLSGGDIKI
ncbi:MAG TPA: aldo/keto reductase [Spirochaetia bacterium]|nr:aldo/keto reductase [Spirochaetia bacterium]